MKKQVKQLTAIVLAAVMIASNGATSVMAAEITSEPVIGAEDILNDSAVEILPEVTETESAEEVQEDVQEEVQEEDSEPDNQEELDEPEEAVDVFHETEEEPEEAVDVFHETEEEPVGTTEESTDEALETTEVFDEVEVEAEVQAETEETAETPGKNEEVTSETAEISEETVEELQKRTEDSGESDAEILTGEGKPEMVGASFGDAIEIKSGDIVTANVGEGETIYYVFKPAETTVFIFEAHSSDDTYCVLYNSSFEEIDSDDDGGEGSNFRLTTELTEGSIYYLGVRFYSESSSGSFEVSCKTFGSIVGDIAVGDTVTADAGNGEMVYYVIEPAETNVYSFEINSTYDTYCALYDDDFYEMISSDGIRLNSLLRAGETYYLGVSFYDEGNSGSVEVSCNSPISAGTLEENKSITAKNVKGQALSYTFTPEETGIYTIESDGGSDVDYCVYDEDWDRIYSRDIQNTSVYPMGAGETSHIIIQIPESYERQNLTIKMASKELDVLSLGDTVTVELNQGEEAYYVIRPAETSIYRFNASGSDEPCVALYGYTLYGASHYSFPFEEALSGGETYYLCVFDNSDSPSSHIEVSCTSVDVKEQYPFLNDAVELKNGDIVTNYVGEGETFYYEIKPTETQVYVFESHSETDSSYGGYISCTLYDSVFEEIEYDSFRIGSELTGGETYYLGICYQSSEDCGEVTVSCKTAKTISLGESLELQIEKDEIFYMIEPDVTQRYIFELFAQSDIYVSLDLYDSRFNYIESISNSVEELEAGKRYFLGVDGDETYSGTIEVSWKKAVLAGSLEADKNSTEEVIDGQFSCYSFTPTAALYRPESPDDINLFLYDEEWERISPYTDVRHEAFYNLTPGKTYYVGAGIKKSYNKSNITIKMASPTVDGEISVPGSHTFTLAEGEHYYYRVHSDKELDVTATFSIDNVNPEIHPWIKVHQEKLWNWESEEDRFDEISGNKSVRFTAKSGENYIVEVSFYDYYGGATSYFDGLLELKEFSGYPIVGNVTEGGIERIKSGFAYSFVPNETGTYYMNRNSELSWYDYSAEIYNKNWDLLDVQNMRETIPSAEMEAGETYYIRISSIYDFNVDITMEQYHEPVILNQLEDIYIGDNQFVSFRLNASAIGAKYKWEEFSANSLIREYDGGPTNSYWGDEEYDGLQIRCTITDIKGKSVSSNMATIHIGGNWYSTWRDEVTGVKMEFRLYDNGTADLYSCSELEGISELHIPATVDNHTVTGIEDAVFKGQTSITGVEIPDTVTWIGESAFDGTSLRSLKLPANLKTIEKDAFAGNNDITILDFPESLSVIEENAFTQCVSIHTVSINKNIQHIDYAAFLGDSNITDVYYAGTETEWNSMVQIDRSSNSDLLSADMHFASTMPAEKTNGVYSYVIKDDGSATITGYTGGQEANIPATIDGYNVSEIASGAFSKKNELISVVIPDSVVQIGNRAFADSVNLTSVTMSNSLEKLGAEAFSGCKSLKSIVLPDTLTVIPFAAFFSCWELESVRLPSNLTEIGELAFSNDIKLASVEFPDTLTKIGKAAYKNCTSLEKVFVPEQVNYISYEAFFGCEKLEVLTLAGAETIQRRAFAGCGSLATVKFPEELKKVYQYAFCEDSMITDIYYSGDRAHWGNVRIHEGNETLQNAQLHVGIEAVTDVTIDQSILNLKVRESASLIVTVFPENATNKTVSWSSSDNMIAAVDESGTVKAIKKGTADITVTTEDGGFTAVCKVTVEAPNVSGVKLDKETLTLKRGETGKLTATVEPADAEDKSVTWTSSDKTVATVDAEGNITTLKIGTADITATTVDGGFTAVCKVTVEAPNVSGITLDNETLTLKRGETGKLIATIEPTDAADKSVTWSSSDETVATVDAEGNITTLKIGTADITATTVDGGFTAVCKMTVEAPNVSGVSLDVTTVSLTEGEDLQLNAMVDPEDAGDKSVTWSSSDPTVAEVDADGLVKALKAGTADITVATTDGGFTAVCSVTVMQKITFTDVADPSAWYYDSVYWAVRNGVTSGMGEGTFQPMAKLSRAQAVTFLYNLAGRPDVSGLPAKEFTDVSKTAWYYNAVKWAVANKITSGYGTGTFQPNATCNRAMIVTFLANYAKVAGTYKEPTTSASFKDVKAKDWFKKSVDWAVENGITSGYGQGTFSPNVTCNRAMMVTFLKKVAELPTV